ncbi:PREDICTED: odorant-binding protein 2b-like [Galeopterus variegatus]|uniref:Odorant-binding protein 2b-like n=1 Tax=Galeopterus variegatus TaxID=482537 RepID=A0ABM0SBZ4_GALVR|nr:PREDICTED: odorant-binding protein 2b-like [Galeopterus variegatus]
METLFLTVVLGLVAALQAQDPLSFTSEEQDLTGTWYVKAVVTGKELLEGKRPSKVSPVTVTALEGGDLEVTFTIMKEGQCHQKKILMQKTEEPGKYSTFGGKKLMYLQELPVKDHDIWYCTDHGHGKRHLIGNLMVANPSSPSGYQAAWSRAAVPHSAHLPNSPTGRSPDVNPDALEEFKKFVHYKGFLEDNIFTPTQMGERTALTTSPSCPPLPSVGEMASQ